MNMQTSTDVERTNDRTVGPGGQLRQARLDLKLAPEDVAHILHLSPRQIVALENDDYEALPGPTYVRGYLRGYAQLLGLAAEPVIETYNRQVAARTPVDLGKLAPQTEIRSDHQLIKFATIGVVAIVLGLSAVWWSDQDRPAQRTQAVSQATPTEETPTDEEEAPVEDDNVPAASALNAPAPAASVKLPVAPVVPETAPTTTPSSTATVPLAATAQPVATGPRGRLVLQVQTESWVDVRDAQGNRLLYEMIPAGRSVTVEGIAPLAVFLGNAEGVRVEFNGQPFDVRAHKRGDIARFTLGGARTP